MMKKEGQEKEEELESIRDGLSDVDAEKMSRLFREKQRYDEMRMRMVGD